MYLDKINYPKIFAAYENLWLDVIGDELPLPDQNGVDIGDMAEYGENWQASDLPEIEQALASLTEKDLETFCVGESDDQIAIRDRSPSLFKAWYFVENAFESIDPGPPL